MDVIKSKHQTLKEDLQAFLRDSKRRRVYFQAIKYISNIGFVCNTFKVNKHNDGTSYSIYVNCMARSHNNHYMLMGAYPKKKFLKGFTDNILRRYTSVFVPYNPNFDFNKLYIKNCFDKDDAYSKMISLFKFLTSYVNTEILKVQLMYYKTYVWPKIDERYVCMLNGKTLSFENIEDIINRGDFDSLRKIKLFMPISSQLPF